MLHAGGAGGFDLGSIMGLMFGGGDSGGGGGGGSMLGGMFDNLGSEDFGMLGQGFDALSAPMTSENTGMLGGMFSSLSAPMTTENTGLLGSIFGGISSMGETPTQGLPNLMEGVPSAIDLAQGAHLPSPRSTPDFIQDVSSPNTPNAPGMGAQISQLQGLLGGGQAAPAAIPQLLVPGLGPKAPAKNPNQINNALGLMSAFPR